MKSLFKIFLLIALVGTFAACDNSTTDSTEEDALSNAPKYIMTALIDSVAWTATSVDTREELGTIYITGIAADGSQLILELGEKPRVGIFPMRRGSVQAGTYVNKEGSKYYAPFAGTTGVINITEFAKDSVLKAEFNFSASNTMDLHLIEGGSFIAPIHKEVESPVVQ